MSSSTLLAELNRIDKDIADQEKKKAGFDKKASDLENKIIDTQKSIKSTTSSSMVSSKRRQIEGYGKDKAKAVQDSANCTDKISKLREKRNSKNQQYQKALADEQKASAKKQSQQMKSIQDKYESRIRDLETQLSASVTSAVNNMSEENFASDGEESYDVFISHASEDKEDFVDELVDEMRKLDIKVWYDTTAIKWGDSIRAKIDEGLRKSKFGIAVLSPAYIAEGKYWTKAELDALFQNDSAYGKRLLPIWYNLTYDDLMNYSPMLAGRKGLQSKYVTTAGMAQQFRELLDDIYKDE